MTVVDICLAWADQPLLLWLLLTWLSLSSGIGLICVPYIFCLGAGVPDPAEELEDDDVDETECLRWDPDFDLDDEDDREEDNEDDPDDEALDGYELNAIVDEDNIEAVVNAE